ncbi:MAG: WXG100 family type VII secretion target [Clostridiales bacterium]|nr:WXG100 family type VII secretion target [Clostridiales bacterium]
MAKIKLTPEELLAQSTEMASIQSEFETLFSQVTSCLNSLNGSWSDALASNFSGKITAAQRSFSSVAEMMANGSAAARVGANTFSEPGAVLALLCGGGSLGGNSELLSWIAENVQEGGSLKNTDLVIGELSKLTGIDISSAKDVISKIASGDYEGALAVAGEKGIDWAVSGLSGEIGSDSWVGKMEELTGGKLGLSGLEEKYWKNLAIDTAKNGFNIGKEIGKEVFYGEGDMAYAAKQLGEMAWNAGPGEVIKTGSDAAFDVVKNLPFVGEYYAEKGVTDGEGAIGSMIEDVTLMVTGDPEAAAADGNYYKEHGGIAGGIVDGVVEIGGFVGEKMGELWHSAFGD